MPPLPTDAIKVVRLGVQGPPGSAGNIRLLNLADVDSTQLTDGALLIYDSTLQKFRTLNKIEQNQIINGGYF